MCCWFNISVHHLLSLSSAQWQLTEWHNHQIFILVNILYVFNNIIFVHKEVIYIQNKVILIFSIFTNCSLCFHMQKLYTTLTWIGHLLYVLNEYVCLSELLFSSIYNHKLNSSLINMYGTILSTRYECCNGSIRYVEVYSLVYRLWRTGASLVI